MPRREGCAVCGGQTPKKDVSPYEEVSATYCDDCRTLVINLEELVEAVAWNDQAIFQLATLRRLRRVEEVAHELVHRRMRAALRSRASWEDISEALGMQAEEAMRTYPSWDTPEKNWGWG